MSTMTHLATGTSPAVPPLPADQRLVGASSEAVRDSVLSIITAAMAAHPRSLQKRIGPSEMGTPCTRKLTFKLAGTPERERPPAWRPQVGTFVHAGLAEAAVAANLAPVRAAGADVDLVGATGVLAEHLGPLQVLRPDGTAVPVSLPELRYVVEATVDVGEVDGTPITGSCDLYDRVTATVVDWKIVGTSTLRRVKANGPSATYRAQAHLYGRGWVRRGVPCERVAVMFLPSSGELTEAVWWSEPWDEQVALDALARADAVAAGIRVAGADAMVRAAPTADDYCTSCPFLARGSTDPTRGCPGHVDPDAAPFQPPTPGSFLMGAK